MRAMRDFVRPWHGTSPDEIIRAARSSMADALQAHSCTKVLCTGRLPYETLPRNSTDARSLPDSAPAYVLR